jgi:hypothetical protein
MLRSRNTKEAIHVDGARAASRCGFARSGSDVLVQHVQISGKKKHFILAVHNFLKSTSQ